MTRLGFGGYPEFQRRLTMMFAELVVLAQREGHLAGEDPRGLAFEINGQFQLIMEYVAGKNALIAKLIVPVVVLVARWYTRSGERLEAEFEDLVSRR